MARLLLVSTALLSGCENGAVPRGLDVRGDAPRGKAVVERVACGVCHVIPGAIGPRGRVGPSLEGFGARALIAGAVPNRPEILVRFVQNAPSLVPNTAMPPLPLDQQEARDVSAFLYTLQ